MVNYIQKHEPSGEDRVKSSERDLWVAVLGRALLDAFQQAPHLNLNLKMNRTHDMYYKYNSDQARHFFLKGGWDFKIICEFAGRNPVYVQQKMRKMILRENGWNVDVPITSHYRQGPKHGRKRGRYKKKHLTGNAYYAAKAKKNFYYQGMGSKGGRPRIYNKIKVA